jgi:hypothetical protein
MPTSLTYDLGNAHSGRPTIGRRVEGAYRVLPTSALAMSSGVKVRRRAKIAREGSPIAKLRV